MQKDAHTLAGKTHGILGDKGQTYAEPRFRKMSRFAAPVTFGLVTAAAFSFLPLRKGRIIMKSFNSKLRAFTPRFCIP